MYTQCPQCFTVYRVDGETLAAARGNVRCIDCETVFDALATLTELLPPEPVDRLPAHAAQAEPPRLTLPILRPDPAQTLFVETPTPARATRTPAPTFARRRGLRKARNSGRWLAACSVLLLTLGAQIAWSQRADWIDDARVRGVLDPLCARLSCRLPLRHDSHTLELLSRDIQPHPSVPGALIISATVRNDAPFAQAFPVVEIVLSDLDERRVAMRRFQPAEYLTDPQLLAAGLAAGASAALVFEVVDPGRDAVAFEFRFD